jgi:hypothetical protein
MQRQVNITTQNCRESISTVSFSPFDDTQDLLAYGTQSGLTVLKRNSPNNASVPYSQVTFFPTNTRIIDIAFSRQSTKEKDSYYIIIATCAEDDQIRVHTYNDTPGTILLQKNTQVPNK